MSCLKEEKETYPGDQRTPHEPLDGRQVLPGLMFNELGVDHLISSHLRRILFSFSFPSSFFVLFSRSISPLQHNTKGFIADGTTWMEAARADVVSVGLVNRPSASSSLSSSLRAKQTLGLHTKTRFLQMNNTMQITSRMFE